MEQVILVCKEMNNLVEVQQYAEKACNLYQQHGSPEAGAAALDKAAKMLEAEHPEKALSLYQHALDVVMVSFIPWLDSNLCERRLMMLAFYSNFNHHL